MLVPAMIALLAAATQAAPPITVTGRAWAPFISPMGEPFRAKSKADNTLALWFVQADRNHDGMLTADEMQADAGRFFARLDTDHNGAIEPEELVRYEWELAPEIQVNSRWRRPPGQPAATVRQSEAERKRIKRGHGESDGLLAGLNDPLQGAARYALLNMPEPVAAADADFNRAITLTEFRQAALERFRLLDKAGQGRITLAELQALVPPPPKGKKRARRKDDEPDARVGVPLPPGD